MTKTTVVPPVPQRLRRWGRLYRAGAHLSYLSGFAFSAMASLLMLSSAALAGAAGSVLAAGERLRRRGLILLSLGHPVAAVAYQAREVFYQRRKQGVLLD